MKENGATEEEAYAKFRVQIAESWKDINEECLEPREAPLPLLMRVVNFARFMDIVYEEEDCYTHAGGLMKELTKSTFIDPIPIWLNAWLIVQSYKNKNQQADWQYYVLEYIY